MEHFNCIFYGGGHSWKY